MDEEENKQATSFRPVWIVSAASFTLALILCIASFIVFRQSVSTPYYALAILSGLLFILSFVTAIIAKAKRNRFSLPFIIASPIGFGFLFVPLLAIMALGFALGGGNRNQPSPSLLESVKIENFLASCERGQHSFTLYGEPDPVTSPSQYDYDGRILQAMKAAEYSEEFVEGYSYSSETAFIYENGYATYLLYADYQRIVLSNHDDGSFWNAPIHVGHEYYLPAEQGKAIYDAAKASAKAQADAYDEAYAYAGEHYDMASFLAQEEEAPFIRFHVWPEEGQVMEKEDSEKAILAKMKTIPFAQTGIWNSSQVGLACFVYNPPNTTRPTGYRSYLRLNKEKDLAEIYFPFEDACGKSHAIYKTFSLAKEDGEAIHSLALSLAEAD